jgi:hypothetical protein
MENDDLQGQQGNLTYWAARQAVVAIASPLAVVYVCQLMFNRKDGGIFVQFPHFRHHDGIATVVRLERDGAGKRTIQFLDEGKVTSHLVKYSHHPDGRVHFSQDRKVRTEIKRQAAFPLDGPIGTLFQLNAFYPVGGFLSLDESNLRRGRPHLIFNYKKTVPEAVRITGKWYRKEHVASWSRPAGAPIGPKAELHGTVTGGRAPAYFLGQPPGFPLQDHLLVVICERVQTPSGVDRPTVIFMGGSDSDEVERSGDPARPSEYLSAMYPVDDPARAKALVGTIDFHEAVAGSAG